jgi:hypothetical protein
MKIEKLKFEVVVIVEYDNDKITAKMRKEAISKARWIIKCTQLGGGSIRVRCKSANLIK